MAAVTARTCAELERVVHKKSAYRIDLTLSAGQLKTVDEASRIELGFPHDLYAKELPRTFAYGGLPDQILAA
jgi:hypothetical protein